MLQAIKNFLKRFLPPPTRAFNREVERILKEIMLLKEDLLAGVELHHEEETKYWEKFRASQETLLNKRDEQFRILQMELTEIRKDILILHEEMAETHKKISQMQGELLHDGKALDNAIQNTQDKLLHKIDDVNRHVVDASRNGSEAVWAETFNNTISGSAWLKNTAFSPGRWAVGYPHLYVMYRILNESRPKRILELGLGQSTRMIAQYVSAHEDVEHVVVEHDSEWIAFFENSFELPSRSKIIQLDREMVPYKEAEAVRVFKDFRKTFQNQKFDFISIDAPLGGDMKLYSRIDILSILPECLSENFVMMIDDCERSGEANTVVEIENCLKKSGVPYKRGKYSGKRDFVLFAAEHKGFLTTM